MLHGLFSSGPICSKVVTGIVPEVNSDSDDEEVPAQTPNHLSIELMMIVIVLAACPMATTLGIQSL